MIIYKITNTVNGKVYVGLTTTTLCNRWCKHKQDSKTCNRHLYKSMRKYGLENFTIEEIDNTEDFKELGRLERYYIQLYDSQNPDKGYNITAGGESNQLDANPRTRLKVSDVVQIREIYSYGELSKSKDSFRSLIANSYKHLPIYSKIKRIWLLNGNEVDINNYNPVSTILESEE